MNQGILHDSKFSNLQQISNIIHSDYLFTNMLSICRSEQDITLPELGRYATGLMFIEAREMDEVQTEFTKMATQIGLEVGLSK